MTVENFLKAKTLGLPRWAWGFALTGAVILGLYLRRRAAESESESTGETEGAAEGEGVYSAAEGGGLGVAGLVGPAAGQVVPVETPMLPEGFVDVFGQLADTISQLGSFITEHQNVVTEVGEGGGAPVTPSGEAHEVPVPAVPGPHCPNATVQKMGKNKNEISRLQGEINNLQQEVNTLTNNIQSHPNAKNVGDWKKQRANDQANIAGKRAKISALSAENVALRKIPGCSKVSV